MTSDRYEDIPLACNLTPAELSVRGEENTELFALAHTLRELPDGFSFGFPASDEQAQAVLRFVLAERACCPFFTFDVAFPAPHEAIWLTIRGREGVKEIVREAMVGKLTPAAGA